MREGLLLGVSLLLFTRKSWVQKLKDRETERERKRLEEGLNFYRRGLFGEGTSLLQAYLRWEVTYPVDSIVSITYIWIIPDQYHDEKSEEKQRTKKEDLSFQFSSSALSFQLSSLAFDSSSFRHGSVPLQLKNLSISNATHTYGLCLTLRRISYYAA